MIEKGILKGKGRKEEIWKRTKLGEPFKEALDTFREQIADRKDLDPTSLLQFGLFMSMAVLNILKNVEEAFGKEGHEIVANALIQTGKEVGRQMIVNTEIPDDIKPIELMSFLATIINTQAWTSLEEPRIDNDTHCSFDILWCPLQDVYNAFDCRVQRYLVQGIVDAFRESGKLAKDYQIKFTCTIPAGADCCTFVIKEKKPGEKDDWEEYSKELERRALRGTKREE